MALVVLDAKSAVSVVNKGEQSVLGEDVLLHKSSVLGKGKELVERTDEEIIVVSVGTHQLPGLSQSGTRS